MKKHKGMRPQDIVILLKIAVKGDAEWFLKDIAYELAISQSEVSESLNRSVIAGLINNDKRTIMKLSLLEFIKYGLKYVFPQQPGRMVRGMATAHSAPPLNQYIQSKEIFVWPWEKGTERGFEIEPLYATVPAACQKDNKLYELLALVDAIRVGKKREQQFACEKLELLL